MACEDQINLSNYIKSVHENLRENTKKQGYETAWKNHCENDEILKKYSRSMRDLATNYWENNSKLDEKAVSRIKWIHQSCVEYFESIDNYRSKEKQVLEKIGENLDVKCVLNKNKVFNMLDVGSCYNPFENFDCYNVTAIDIAPACDSVHKCDFLNVSIEHNLTFVQKTIKTLPKDNFDIVVFSLLLEYLPVPELRLLCVQKAYDLLKTEGILVIITPDSNHINSNAQIIKSWKYILADLGFNRVKYEKLSHLHCMMFRKAFDCEITKRWSDLHRNKQMYDKIYIPQDFKNK